VRSLWAVVIGTYPNGQALFFRHDCRMTNEDKYTLPCSEEDRNRIIQEAVFRQGFILWLAAHLRKPRCPDLIKLEAAQALEQLVS
jgi:hypothetical protein